MKKIKSFIAILLVSLLFSSYSFSYYSEATPNVDINSFSFVANMNTGLNLGNSLDSHYGNPTGDANLSQETIWGNPKITKQQIDYIKSLGFDVIRLPVSWHTHTLRDNNGTIHINSDWMSRVQEVVDYCISDGFYVIINTHHDDSLFHCGVSNKEFDQVKADATSIWREISTAFASYDQHLVYESFNEVDNLAKSWQFGSKAASQMNELNQVFVDTVRSCGGNNSSRILMVPTLLDSYGTKFQNAFSLPKDIASNKLIVTIHDYRQAFDQSMDSTFSEISSFSQKIGVPIIIGEWGTTVDFSPSQYRSIHAGNYIARATKYGIKCIYWDNGSNYAIIDRKKLSSNKDMISAIMNPREYTSTPSDSIADPKNYLYKTIDQTTGELVEDKHWGTLLVNTNGNGGYSLPEGKTTMYLGLVATGDMSNQRIHYVYFFDAKGKLLDKINNSNGFAEKEIAIPAGAAFVRIGVNNSYSKTSEAEYKQAIIKGTLKLLINLY